MKILARKEHEDAYILEASGDEIRLIAQIESALEGQTSNDAILSDVREKLRLPNHIRMTSILWDFLRSLRSHNDFANSFENLKELLGNRNGEK